MKKKIGLLKAVMLCGQYKKKERTEREKIREERFQNIVQWAKENSPYYSRLYKDISLPCKLSELPPVSKSGLMANFNDWITDRQVRLSDLYKYMENLDNIGRKFLGKYLVFTTSGSTGNPLVSLYDSTANNVMGGINVSRGIARKKDLTKLFKSGGKSIGIYATGGFYLSNSSIRARVLAMPWKKRQMAVTSALLPIDQIVAELNRFQPAMLGGYPSNLELLIDEQKNGQLQIHPVLIMTGGEYLSEELRKNLSDVFGCYVQTSYSCTEGGSIACECTEHHFHINEDWVIIEAVDQNNNPVPDGVRSDKILLTNLSNYTQPFIRYEVTDRVVMHHEPCACGSDLPWLSVEGRTDDVVTFFSEGREIKIAPLAIYAILKQIHELRRFQLISSGDSQIELRLEVFEEYERSSIFEKAKGALTNFFQTHGISNSEIILSDQLPMPHEKSGKFKHIINRQK